MMIETTADRLVHSFSLASRRWLSLHEVNVSTRFYSCLEIVDLLRNSGFGPGPGIRRPRAPLELDILDQMHAKNIF